MAKTAKKAPAPDPLSDLEEGTSFTAGPTREQSSQLTELGNKLLSLDADVVRLKRELADAQEKGNHVRFEELPLYMQSIGQNVVGLAEAGVTIVLEPFYYANIAADWEPEKREKAFRYLEERGDGDLIKLNVVFPFRRGELEKAQWLQRVVTLFQTSWVRAVARLMGQKGFTEAEEAWEMPEPVTREEVHHGTLTAWLRTETEAGRSVDLDLIGGRFGQVAKIKKGK